MAKLVPRETATESAVLRYVVLANYETSCLQLLTVHRRIQEWRQKMILLGCVVAIR